MCGGFDLKPLFLGRLRPERLTSNQIVSQQSTSFAWRQKQPIYCNNVEFHENIICLHVEQDFIPQCGIASVDKYK